MIIRSIYSCKSTSSLWIQIPHKLTAGEVDGADAFDKYSQDDTTFSVRNAPGANHMDERTYKQQSDSKRVIRDFYPLQANRSTAEQPRNTCHGGDMHT